MRHLNTILRLTLLGMLVAIALAGVDMLTRSRIDTAKQRSQLQTLIDLTGDRRLAQMTGTAVPPLAVCTPAGMRLYRVVEAAARGYGGTIQLLVGIDSADRVTGVRAVRHSETPGIGDVVDIESSDWIDGFIGVPAPAASDLALTRDGGTIDAVTGATITTRAVVAAIRNSLLALNDAPSQTCSNVIEY
jgi:Na+-translocating ferredoxin:NAD+ oxidoreductase subunit G